MNSYSSVKVSLIKYLVQIWFAFTVCPFPCSAYLFYISTANSPKCVFVVIFVIDLIFYEFVIIYLVCWLHRLDL